MSRFEDQCEEVVSQNMNVMGATVIRRVRRLNNDCMLDFGLCPIVR